MLRTILLGLGIFAALLSVLIFSGKIPLGNPETKAQGEVLLWGTFPDVGMNDIIRQFNPEAEKYRVVYREVREDAFAQTLLEALANGQGPDLILAPHQIILSQLSRLYPFPLASFSEKSFKDTYINGASVFFSPSGAIALPVSVEPLVLFYNRTLFAKHGIITPPVYWDEVTSIAPKLNILNQQGQLVESGISLGASNTPHAKDILMAIVMQLKQTPVFVQYREDGTILPSVLANEPLTENGEIKPLATALRFFTQFADPTKSTYTWSQFATGADDLFVSEKLAMYVGYSGELKTLRSRNPKADFAMTYLPQTRGYNTFVTGARMYGIAALRTSRNLTTALTVQAEFAGGGVSPVLSSLKNGVPAIRNYSTTAGLDDVVARSMLVAQPWYDSFPVQSTSLSSIMSSDVINNRYGVSDAASIFVSRLQDLYTPH